MRQDASALPAGTPAAAGLGRPVLRRRLTSRLVLLAIAFVLLGEVLIYLPSIARFRLVALQERITAAHLATLSLGSRGAADLAPGQEAMLLGYVGAEAITLHRPSAQLMLGTWRPSDVMVDLRQLQWWRLIPDALRTLAAGGQRTIQVVGPSPDPAVPLVDIIMGEGRLWAAMVDYSVRILTLSVLLSLLVALLLVLSLELLIVRPLRRLTGELAAFRDAPEDATRDPPAPPARRDEIGTVERELGQMRLRLRRALAEKTRLAALGSAMSRINHDLRNLLASAVLISDRLEHSGDPEVRRVAPRLVASLDRAGRLCLDTLDYAHSRPAVPRLQALSLLEQVEAVRGVLAERREPVRWRINVPEPLAVLADPDQLHRVLLNLATNAYAAMGAPGGELCVEASDDEAGLVIRVQDSGPGIPAQLRAVLFEPFGSGRGEGSGLGLAICRELMRMHGGEITLLSSEPGRTIFELRLPPRLLVRGRGRRGEP